MRTALPKQTHSTRSHRPRAVTVFAAAFVAGAAAAVGVNRALDVRLAQSKPRVESEAIFVALRSLPQGAAVTVWDVALREWPKAMLPASALRASDTFSGQLLKHPLREGQPLLSIQLLPAGEGAQPASGSPPAAAPADYTRSPTPVAPAVDADLWAPAEPIKVAALPTVQAAPSAQTVIPAQTAVREAAPQPAPSTSEPPAAAAQVTDPAPQVTASPDLPASPVPQTAAVQEATVPVSQPEQQASTATSEPVVTEPSAATTSTAETDTVASAVAGQAPDQAVDQAPAQDGVTGSLPREAGEVTPQGEVAEVIEATVPNAPGPAPEPEPAPAAESTATVAPAPAPIAAEPTAPPRPVHGRYLVVPESIALQADTSFVNRADAQPQAAEPAPRNGAHATAETVRPLPPTNATARSPQHGSPQARAPQGRPNQRQGRQPAPATAPGTNGRPTESQPSPQPRFGTTMFPNLSAGMSAVEGRLRRDQPEQSRAPAAARPITAR